METIDFIHIVATVSAIPSILAGATALIPVMQINPIGSLACLVLIALLRAKI